MTAAAISIEHLHKRLGGGWALQGISLTIEPGEIVALLGPNGAGKSTLIHCLCGRLRPDEGRVRVHGLDPIRRASRRRLGLVPQDLALFPVLSAKENLEIFARLLRVPRRQVTARVRICLDQAGLADRADHPVETLSGGMRRRLNLAASLVHEPDVLLLDEPTVGIDALALDGIERVLGAQRAGGAALVIVTHDLELAERLADRVVMMSAGRVRAEGAPADLIEQLFGGRLDVSLTLPQAPDATLQSWLGERAFTRRGERSFTGRCAGDVVDTLLHELNALGIRARELRVRDPGLADVYEAVQRGEVPP